MHKLHSFILTAHRILGTLLSILFCMWFLSGLVMIYHSFPRVNKTDKWSKMENLKDFGNLPAWEEIQASIPADERIKRITRTSVSWSFTFKQTKGITNELPISPNGPPSMLPISGKPYRNGINHPSNGLTLFIIWNNGFHSDP